MAPSQPAPNVGTVIIPGEPTASLVSALDPATVHSPPAGRVTAICQDSRQVRPGAAFVAVPGSRLDGHAFLRHARANGARLLVVQDDHRPIWEELRYAGTGLVSVPDTRSALGRLAAAFHGYPARDLTVVGVTGTDGKTTTCFLTAAVLAAGGLATATLSTVGTVIDGSLVPNQRNLTTPPVVEVQRFLADARAAGAAAAVLEASSHGLDQGRLAEADVDIAVLTTLTGDHLDYHGSRQAYLLAKAKLFEAAGKAAVLDAGDPAAGALAARTSARCVFYRTAPGGADLTADQIVQDGWRTSFRLLARGQRVPVTLALPGRFNVHNALAAASAGLALGLDLAQIRRGLESVQQVPGRMERVGTGSGPVVVVDYAHTGYELSQALSCLRGTCHGRLIAVFGCAGDRDPSRRAGMGRVAARQADYTVVTSEHTWTEPADQVIKAVVAGLAAAGGQHQVRADRREAIRLALSLAGPDDTVLVAGMGHEQTMIVAGRPEPWDDRAVIRELTAAALTA